MTEKIPFSQDEMVPTLVMPGRRGAPDRTIFTTPITLGENMLMTLRDHSAMYIANVFDMKPYHTRLIPDNIARNAVLDGGDPRPPRPEGELDAFGVKWLFEPQVGGSMVPPGNPLMDDIEDWEEVIQFPNPDEWDWEGAAKLAEPYLANCTQAVQSTLFTGYFERLISWMDFEDAAVTMIDEDAEDSLEALFSRLTDLYIGYVDNLAKWIHPDVIQLHDDWGSQMAPFMSYDTYEEKIVPHMKRFNDRCHEHGIFTDLHSCGHVDSLVPLMIEAGFDSWQGQCINDKLACVQNYGDKICIQVEVPEFGLEASDDEIREGMEKWCADYIIDGKMPMISLYSKEVPNRPYVTDVLYELSRQSLCGEA